VSKLEYKTGIAPVQPLSDSRASEITSLVATRIASVNGRKLCAHRHGSLTSLDPYFARWYISCLSEQVSSLPRLEALAPKRDLNLCFAPQAWLPSSIQIGQTCQRTKWTSMQISRDSMHSEGRLIKRALRQNALTVIGPRSIERRRSS
jgi:hypothetical protein